MGAARMHGYKQPVVLEDIKVPEIAPDQVIGEGWRSGNVSVGPTNPRSVEATNPDKNVPAPASV